MKFKKAARVSHPTFAAFVGAGGKTTALFLLARQFGSRVIVSTSTHLAVHQASLADQHIILKSPHLPANLSHQFSENIILVSGPIGDDDRIHGLNASQLDELSTLAMQENLSLLIEADGSRGLPLKAPAQHEPVIPPWINCVFVCAGLKGYGQLLMEENVHRPEIFAQLSGGKQGQLITPGHVSNVLRSPAGGLKNIPQGARKIALLNQADTPQLQALAAETARSVLPSYDSVLIASLKNPDIEVASVHEQTAGIILAAGGSSRFGQPKIMLNWGGIPLIRKEAQTALAAGLSPVIIVLGAVIEPAMSALADLPVQIVINEQWQAGQGQSVRTGTAALPSSVGSAIFLLADQPQVTVEVLQALIHQHQQSLSPILAPFVNGKRLNPVLFDRVTFKDLQQLQGDMGGRSLFSRYEVEFMPWHDSLLAMDIDTPEDYQKLLEMQQDE
jgi:molybdenum cofactor cytidylyltransferase